MKKSDKPLVPPLPHANRNMLDKLLDPQKDENLRETSLLLSLGHDNMAARLFSSMTPTGHPAFPYRLETVAYLAALLKKDCTPQEAAKEALALLDACKAELSEITLKEAKRLDDHRLRWEAMPVSMNFAETARYVTQQDKDEAAQPMFRQFIERSLLKKKVCKEVRGQFAEPPETNDTEVAQWIEEHCNQVAGEQLHAWRELFSDWQAVEKFEEASRISKVRSASGSLGGRGKKKPVS
jgi:hypothetical protein